jgi:nucleotide-binding universal stress UspA family protein
MGRCLIVANQTLGGAQLERKISELIADGVTRFHVVVPVISPNLEAETWMFADVGGFAIPPPDPAVEDAEEEAVERSERRLALMIDAIRSAGGEADGEVGVGDPLAAVRAVCEREDFELVIVSTLPAGLSRWLRMDLPSRVARTVDVPVVTVEAEG